MTIVKSEYMRWGWKKQKEEKKKKENTREIVGEAKSRKTGRLMKSIKDKKKELGTTVTASGIKKEKINGEG